MHESTAFSSRQSATDLLRTSWGAIRVLPEPLLSSATWLAANWGRTQERAFARNPDLKQFFGPDEPVEEKDPVKPAEIPQELTKITQAFLNSEGEPHHFLGGERFGVWREIAEVLSDQIRTEYPSAEFLDYLISTTEDFYLVFIVDNQLLSCRVHREQLNFTSDSVLESTAVLLPNIAEIIPYMSEWQAQDLQQPSSLELELAVQNALNAANIAAELLKVSPLANSFYLNRHLWFDREGQLITFLRHQGIYTLGEMQTVQRVLFNEGWYVDRDSGELVYDRELCNSWIECRALPLASTEISADLHNQYELEASNFLHEQAYYRAVLAQLRGSELVLAFAGSEVYRRFAMEFKDRHLASFAVTEIEVAAAMLAGIYLWLFEAIVDPADSPSQHFLASINDYHQDLLQFIRDFKGSKPPIPTPDDPAEVPSLEKKKMQLAQQVIQLDDEQFLTFHLGNFRVTPELKTEAIANVAKCLPEARGQMQRNRVHRRVADFADRTGFVATEGVRSRVGVGETFIGNALLRTVHLGKEQDILYAFPWMSSAASGYLGRDREVNLPPPFENEQFEDVLAAIRHIFGGSDEFEEHPYLAQEQRIIESAGPVLEFLQNDDRVPVLVKTFISELVSGQGMIRVLQTMGSIADNDPNAINRFFPNGLREFHRASMYRYVFDFVRGVETHLATMEAKKIGGAKGFKMRFNAWAGNWRNHTFTESSPDEINQAIQSTLLDGHSRLLELDHAIDDIQRLADTLPLSEEDLRSAAELQYQSTWKTIQEKLEVVFGWDTTSMKYLRWQKYWNVWHTLGASWDCICFTRKTVFNPRPLKTTF